MMREIAAPIYVVGVGPGDPSYVTVQASELIAAADCVAGFGLPLETARRWIRGEGMLLEYRNQEERLGTLARMAAEGKRCVVCAQGDASFSGRELVQRVEAVWPRVEVVPGISSVQIVCARAGLEMEQSLFITLHKRGDTADDLREMGEAVRAGKRTVIALPRPWDFMPAAMASWLLSQGIPGERPVTIYERLTLPDEAVTQTSMGRLAENTAEFSDLSIVVVRGMKHEA